MTFHPDNLLGRDVTLAEGLSTPLSPKGMKVIAFDPERGWRLRSTTFVAWVPTGVLRWMVDEGWLEVA